MPEDNDKDISANDELFEHHRYVADPKQSPIRIDKFIHDKMAKVSRNRIQNAIKAGAIRVDDKEVKPNFKIKPHHVITVVFPKPPSEDQGIIPEEMPIDVRYEDDDLMVIHKPAGLVVHPGVANTSGTLVNGLAYYLQGKDIPVKEGNRNDRPGLVHRIDKGTTGLLVIAKTELAMTHLAKQFFDHTVKRKYLGIVWGNFEEEAGTIEGHIARNPSNRFQMKVFPDGEVGKHAITHYKVVEDLYYVSLVECQLETGRTHQIRVHMKHTGHPLFNDEKYGGEKIMKGTVFTKYKNFVHNTFKLIDRPALHAQVLGFIHPTTGEEMHFEADLPQDMEDCLDRWRKYVSSRKKLM